MLIKLCSECYAERFIVDVVVYIKVKEQVLTQVKERKFSFFVSK